MKIPTYNINRRLPSRARRAKRQLDLPDVLDAIRSGEPEWPADVRRRVACHEAGHAIALLALGIAEPTALSIGGTGGLAESDLGEMRAINQGGERSSLASFRRQHHAARQHRVEESLSCTAAMVLMPVSAPIKVNSGQTRAQPNCPLSANSDQRPAANIPSFDHLVGARQE
jgi:hypothetical protein